MSNVPRIDFSLFTRVPDPTSGAPQPSYVAPKITVKYYSADGMDETMRTAFFLQILHYCDTNEAEDDPTASWIWSLTEMAYPGLVSRLMTNVNGYVFEKVRVVEDEWLHLARNQPNEDLDDLILLPNHNAVELETLPSVLVMCGIYSSMVFALGKRVDNVNISAFNVNRPRAFSNKHGVPASMFQFLRPDALPTLQGYTKWTTYFASHAALRQVFAVELISWTFQSTPAPVIDATAMVAKLWSGYGLTHVSLICNMLLGYGEAILELPTLRTELLDFHRQYRSFILLSDSMKMYTRVIHGDKSTILYSRIHPELLKLARQLAIMVEPRYKQYAAQLGLSNLWDSFQQVCAEKRLLLPTISAAADAEVA